MADFFQTGAIATLHRLGRPDLKRLETDLAEFTQTRPVALVLPCHARELGTPALRHIVHELKLVPYLRQLVVGIDQATAREWRQARKIFRQLSAPKPSLVWMNGARMQRLFRVLTEHELETGQAGKGRNVWMCFGYALATAEATAVAVHDCDIVTYSRELLARLVYPVVHSQFGFDFCKGYYARISNRLNGRAMRLLVTPMIRSLQKIIGPHPFLVRLDTFRYPLAGEFALHIDLVRRTRVPSDWGLEIGLLAEVFRNTAEKSICQSELCDNYEHKHQELSRRDPGKGLNKMALDISKTIFRTMATEGIRLDSGLFDTLLSAYVRQAEDTVRLYAADAAINGLEFDRHQEEVAVNTFAQSIKAASYAFRKDPMGSPAIPNWNRVESALPAFFEELKEAVRLDNEED